MYKLIPGIKERKVGGESRRTYVEKLENGFFDKYMSGEGLELGSSGYETEIVSILPNTKTFNIGDPGYNGLNIPLDDNSQDYLYNSHVLEHIQDYKTTLKEWFRVLKVGGYLVIIVPHQFLYERKLNKPSNWNLDHKRFYTPSSLCKEN